MKHVKIRRAARSTRPTRPTGPPGLPALVGSRGYTFVELLVVSTIILILASAVMPLAKVTATRQREAELRRALREMRTAIDKYKDAADTQADRLARDQGRQRRLSAGSRDAGRGVAADQRRDRPQAEVPAAGPVDPMTHSTEWGMRSYQDKPDTTRWGGQNVFDVYTTFDGTALDGTEYRDW